MFQNQKLSNKRTSLDESSSCAALRMNRDYLPRVCMNVNYAEATAGVRGSPNSRRHFNVKFIFNDYHLTAESSLFRGSSFRVRFYTYSFADTPSYYRQADGKQLSKVSGMRLVKELVGVQPADMIEERLSSGLYMLELLLNQTSRLCPAGMCVDESPVNNRVQCAPCMKLVVHFTLEDDMLPTSDLSQQANSLVIDEWMARHPAAANSGQRPAGPGSSGGSELKKFYMFHRRNEAFKCSRDNLILQHVLSRQIVLSMLANASSSGSGSDTKSTSSFLSWWQSIKNSVFRGSRAYVKEDIYAAVVRADFELDAIALRLPHLQVHTSPETSVPFADFFYWMPIASGIFCLLILLALLVVPNLIVNINKWNKCNNNNNKTDSKNLKENDSTEITENILFCLGSCPLYEPNKQNMFIR